MNRSRNNTYYDDEVSFVKSYNKLHEQIKEKTPEAIIKSYWTSMNSRTKKGVYLRKGIKVLWTYSEFCEWFNSQWSLFEKIKLAGEIPSIDRIDSDSHYCASNCRMIPMSVNSALGEVNWLIARMKTLQTFLNNQKHWLM